MMPKVDTFEVDIADEIKRKEASLADISLASKSTDSSDNDVVIPKKTPVFLVFLGILFFVIVLGLAFVIYFYSTNNKPLQKEVELVAISTPKVADLKPLSPTLSTHVGRFVTRIDKKDQGYVITLSEYPPVFAYMLRNEKDYIREVSSLFAPTLPVAQVPQEKITPSIPASTTTQVTSSTTTSTSTKKEIIIAVSTTTNIEEEVPTLVEGGTFSDVTISNQNMRVWTSTTKKVVYAFVGDTHLLISQTEEGILALRGGILR
jgi:hypothetical protein